MNKLRTQPVILAIDAFLECVTSLPTCSPIIILPRHVHTTYPGVRVFHEDRLDIPHGAEVWRPGQFTSNGAKWYQLRFVRLAGGKAEKIDLVVTLGGDGTILHASSLFSTGAVPPVLSFSMGTLGFLLPFRELLYRVVRCQYQQLILPHRY